jgi:transposase InsO family protein
LADQAAVCSVSSTDDRGKNLFSFDVIDQAPHYPSEGRARWAYPKGVKTLHILGRHPLLQRYFGERLRNQDGLECRLLIAEILADELAAEMLIEQERRAGGQGLQTDAAAYRSRRKTIADELLPIAHRVVVGEYKPEARR